MISIIKRLRGRSPKIIMVGILIRLYQMLRVILYKYIFSTNTAELGNVKLNQPVQFVGSGRIRMKGVVVGVWPSPGYLNSVAYFEARTKLANISVKEGTVFNNGATLIADRSSISIGQNCLIGSNVFITDSDFHGVKVEDRRNNKHACMDVIIGNEVFIGNDVKILKGVSVGDNSVIGVGSVVVKDVPANAVYAGVPAKLVKYL